MQARPCIEDGQNIQAMESRREKNNVSINNIILDLEEWAVVVVCPSRFWFLMSFKTMFLSLLVSVSASDRISTSLI